MAISVKLLENLFSLKNKSLNLTLFKDQKLKVNVKKDLLSSEEMNFLKNNKEKIITWMESLLQDQDCISLQQISPLAPNQQAMWNHHVVSVDKSIFNIGMHYEIKSKKSIKDIDILNAINNTLLAHTALRTKFSVWDDFVIQSIAPLQKASLINESDIDCEVVVKNLLSHEFDLENGEQPIKVTLIKKDEQSYNLVIVAHHIICDGWSMNILMNDVVELLNHSNHNLIGSDFIKVCKTEGGNEISEEFLASLKSAPDVHQIPTDKPRPSVLDGQGKVVEYRLPIELTEKLESLSKKNSISLFTTLYSVLNAYLCELSGQKSFSIGTPVLNRSNIIEQSTVGYFANTSVLVSQSRELNESRLDYLLRCASTVSNMIAHQDVPFSNIVKATGSKRITGVSPLFQVMLVLQSERSQSTNEPKDITFDIVRNKDAAVKYDLTFSFAKSDGTLHLAVEYASALFHTKTIEMYIDNFIGYLNTYLFSDETCFKFVDSALNVKESKFNEFNSKTVLSHILEQCKSNPYATAVATCNASLTYDELIKKSKVVASSVINSNSDLIGVYSKNGLNAIVAIMGILMAGKGYVPIDPAYPKERIEYILTNSNISLVLSDPESSLLNVETRTIQSILKNTTVAELPPVNPKNLAYVIYTSGSTGKPKGVQITHEQLNASLQSRIDYYKTPVRGFLLMSSMSFDSSVAGLYWTLQQGGILYWPTEEEKQNFTALTNAINKHKISHTLMVPSLYNAFISEIKRDDVTSLNTIICAGEAMTVSLSQKHAEWCNKIPCELNNEYGPTEGSVWATVYKCTGRELNTIPIGKALSHIKLSVLSENMQPLVDGAIGELVLSGKGVSKGYFNNKEQTMSYFVDDPNLGFCYKTGDLVSTSHTGDLIFHGRKDNEFKLNGFRINPNEITQALSELVDNSYVFIEQKAIVCVIESTKVTEENVYSLLNQKLPQYMVPSSVVIVDSFPKTANGKIDTKALHNLYNQFKEDCSIYSERNELTDNEKALTAIWEDLLPSNNINVNQNFFTLGGDSISSIQVASRAKKIGINISARDVFNTPTIKELAILADKNANLIRHEVFGDDIHILHPMQSAMLDANLENLNHNNQSLLFESNGVIPQGKIRNIVKFLVRKHPSLTLSFKKESDTWTANYNKPKDAESYIREFIVSGTNEITSICNEAQQSLNLEKGSLFKFVTILDKNKDKTYLFVVIHHIVVDAISWKNILDDMKYILDSEQPVEDNDVNWGYRLATLELSNSSQECPDSVVTYLNNFYPTAKLQKFKKNENFCVKDQKTVSLSIRADELVIQSQDDIVKVLSSAASKFNFSIEELLLTATNKALVEKFDSNKVIIDVENNGRGQVSIDDSESVGWFTHIYPVAINYTGCGKKLDKFIISTKEVFRNPKYAKNKYYHHTDAEYSHAEVLFNFFGDLRTSSIGGDIIISDIDKGNDIDGSNAVKHELVITGMIVENALKIAISYNANSFQYSTIKGLNESILTNLKECVEYCLALEITRKTPSDFPYVTIDEVEVVDSIREQSGNIEDIYPSTPLQMGMLHHSGNKASDYVTQIIIDIKGQLDTATLKKSWLNAIKSNQALRTVFSSDFDVQIIVEEAHSEGWVFIDISELDCTNQEKKILSIQSDCRANGFNLQQAPLSEIVLVKLNDTEFKMIWSNHHALLDGWSATILLNEMFDNYWKIKNNEDFLINTKPQFSEYAKHLLTIDKFESEQYWRTMLKGNPHGELSSFNYDQVNNVENPYCVETLNFPESTVEQITDFTKKSGVTLNTFIHSIWAYIIHSYSGSHNVMFGEVTSGRPDVIENVDQMIGMFINSIPVVVNDFSGTVIEFMQKLQSNSITRRKHELTGMTDIVNYSGIEVGQTLFNTLIVFESFPNIGGDNKVNESGIRPEISKIEERTTFPLTLTVKPSAELVIDFEYYKTDDNYCKIQSIKALFNTLVTFIVDNNLTKVSELPNMSASEFARELADSKPINVTNKYLEDRIPLHNVLSIRSKEHPERVMVSDNHSSLTYENVEHESNKIANTLIRNGVKEGDVVAIYLPRSYHIITSIIGIMKAGAVYVPLDMDYPKDRINYIIDNSKCKIVLSLEDMYLNFDKQCFRIDIDSDIVSLESEILCRDTDEDFNLNAYIIYTSGSTGQPKGVLNSHSSILHYFAGVQEVYKVQEGDRIAQFSSVSFDIFVEEMALTCFTGSSLHFCKEINRSAEDFWNFMKSRKINITSLPTAFLHYLCSEPFFESEKTLPHYRTMIIGGEALSPSAVKRWQEMFNKKVSLLNVYGPTEATVVASYYDATEYENFEQPIPIGYPFKNYSLYVLNESQKVVQRGQVGELYIGGSCLAEGYLNNPEKTNDSFVFVNINGVKERLYKSGDLAKRNRDGSLSYMGRNDDQVKIRGYRVELGEIESVVSNLDYVRNVFIMPFNDNSAIAAYLVVNNEVKEIDILNDLKPLLPNYMLPSSINLIDKLPMTANGKINKKELPEAKINKGNSRNFVEAKTKFEIMVSEVWKEVLVIDKVSIEDSFFSVGGTSLKIAKLKTKLEDVSGHKIDYADIFMRPTIKLQAELLSKGKIFKSELSVIMNDVESKNSGIYCFPGLGAFAHEFGSCINSLDKGSRIISYNPDVKNVESLTFTKAITTYADLVESEGTKYNTLIGHSFGCVTAMAIGEELNIRGIDVKVILLDYFFGDLLPKTTEDELRSLFEVNTSNSEASAMANSKETYKMFELVKRQDAWMMKFRPKFNLRNNVAVIYTKESILSMGKDVIKNNLLSCGEKFDFYEIGENHLSILQGDDFTEVNEIISNYTKL